MELAGKLAEDNHLVYGDNLIEVMNFSMLQAEVSGHACPRLIGVHVRGFWIFSCTNPCPYAVSELMSESESIFEVLSLIVNQSKDKILKANYVPAISILMYKGTAYVIDI